MFSRYWPTSALPPLCCGLQGFAAAGAATIRRDPARAAPASLATPARRVIAANCIESEGCVQSLNRDCQPAWSAPLLLLLLHRRKGGESERAWAGSPSSIGSAEPWLGGARVSSQRRYSSPSFSPGSQPRRLPRR